MQSTRRFNSGYESNDTSFSMDQVDMMPQEEEVEVEVISLQPIGPGLQTLEPDKPEGGRTTPAFPVQGTLILMKDKKEYYWESKERNFHLEIRTFDVGYSSFCVGYVQKLLNQSF